MQGSFFSHSSTRVCAVALLALIGASCGRDSREAAPTPATAPPPPNVRLYVSDETGGSIIVIDPHAGTVVERIAVGKRPRGIRISRDGTHLYVALSGSPIAGPGIDESKLPPADRSADGVGIVNLATHQLERVLHTGQDPEAFDLSPDGKTLYVSNEETAEMSVVDLPAGTTRARVKVGEEPEGVTVTPDGRFIYVTCEADDDVVIVDAATLKVVADLKAAARPRAVAFTPDGATAFVTGENGNAVTVIDTATHKVIMNITIPGTPGTATGPRPMGAVMSPDAKELFVSLGRAGSVAVIDVAKRAYIRSIEQVGARPWGIDRSPDGKQIYTANGPSGDVSIVDIATGTVRRVVTGGSPWGAVAAQIP